MKPIPKIFDNDEMQLRHVDAQWSPDDLLGTEGIFYLKDVCKKLDLMPHKLKKSAKLFEEQGQSAWEQMGIRKTWSHWIVRMKTFAPYYHDHLLPPLDRIQEEWDTNEMLSQKGTFHLGKVAQKLIFTAHNIKYEVRQAKKAKNKIGVWKDEEYKTYLVDMTTFARWIHHHWNNGQGFPRGKHKHIFAEDEMELKQVDTTWTPSTLMKQKGVFLLKPVARVLDVDPADLRKAAKAAKGDGRDPWAEIGIRKALSQWLIHMDRFAPFFKGNKSFKVQRVHPDWDGNDLMTKQGLFNLSDVCTKIPFTAHQFRHQVRHDADARIKYGAWWDPDLRHYLVDMEVFSKWIIDLWTNKTKGF